MHHYYLIQRENIHWIKADKIKIFRYEHVLYHLSNWFVINKRLNLSSVKVKTIVTYLFRMVFKVMVRKLHNCSNHWTNFVTFKHRWKYDFFVPLPPLPLYPFYSLYPSHEWISGLCTEHMYTIVLHHGKTSESQQLVLQSNYSKGKPVIILVLWLIKPDQCRNSCFLS